MSDLVQNDIRLGDYVRSTDHGYKGRVYQLHDNFKETGESEAWFRGQEIPLDPKEHDIPWVSVLVDEGGAICAPITRVVTIAPFDFSNPWASKYFRD
jgi:heat shock protein HspQ